MKEEGSNPYSSGPSHPVLSNKQPPGAEGWTLVKLQPAASATPGLYTAAPSKLRYMKY